MKIRDLLAVAAALAFFGGVANAAAPNINPSGDDAWATMPNDHADMVVAIAATSVAASDEKTIIIMETVYGPPRQAVILRIAAADDGTDIITIHNALASTGQSPPGIVSAGHIVTIATANPPFLANRHAASGGSGLGADIAGAGLGRLAAADIAATGRTPHQLS